MRTAALLGEGNGPAVVHGQHVVYVKLFQLTFISVGMPTVYVLRCCIRSRCAKLGCSSRWFVSFNLVYVILASYTSATRAVFVLVCVCGRTDSVSRVFDRSETLNLVIHSCSNPPTLYV